MTMIPAHLFGLQMFHLVAGGNGGTGILVRRRKWAVLCERVEQQRRGPCARGQRGSARGKPKGQFQKVAAFHDIFLSPCARVMPTDFRRVDMNGR